MYDRLRGTSRLHVDCSRSCRPYHFIYQVGRAGPGPGSRDPPSHVVIGRLRFLRCVLRLRVLYGAVCVGRLLGINRASPS